MASGYIMISWGYGIILVLILVNFNFIILWFDSSPHPPIFGEMEKLPQISGKNWQCPHSPTCCSQIVHRTKTGGIIALHFGAEYACLPLPVLDEAWRTRTSFISEHRSLHYHSPDGATTEHTQRCYGQWCNSSHLVVVVMPVAASSVQTRRNRRWVCGQSWVRFDSKPSCGSVSWQHFPSQFFILFIYYAGRQNDITSPLQRQKKHTIN